MGAVQMMEKLLALVMMLSMIIPLLISIQILRPMEKLSALVTLKIKSPFIILAINTEVHVQPGSGTWMHYIRIL